MPAFDKATRRKIFYSFALLFFVIVPLVILYARGYVFDFGDRRIVATGGIFVKTVETGARVFVDDEFARETSFISRGALITSLLPKRYTVRVEQEGHRPWRKVVRVANEEVLEFRNVFLPPATITPMVVFNTRQRGSSRLVELPGTSEIAVESGAASKAVFFVDTKTRVSRTNIIRVSDWFWDDSTNASLILRESDGRRQWFSLPYAADGSAKEARISFRGLPKEFSAERVTPHPVNADEFYFFAGGALFLQGRARVPVPIAEQVHAYAVAPDRLYFVSQNGFFVESDLDGRETKVLGRKGLLLDPEAPAKIHIAASGDVFVLDAAGGLFHYQPGRDQELGLVAGNVAGFDAASAGDRLLFWDDRRLWVYWLRDNPAQPFDLVRSKKQIFYSGESIRQAFLNSEGTHAFFSDGARIRMTEVDDRGSTNVYDLVVEPHDSFLLDREDLTLFWTKGPQVFRAGLK